MSVNTIYLNLGQEHFLITWILKIFGMVGRMKKKVGFGNDLTMEALKKIESAQNFKKNAER